MAPMKTPVDSPPTDLPECAMLQPLREIGTEDKSQYWDFEDIACALREARRLGIAPERFFQRATEARLARAC
jgi:hypothetical protein